VCLCFFCVRQWSLLALCLPYSQASPPDWRRVAEAVVAELPQVNGSMLTTACSSMALFFFISFIWLSHPTVLLVFFVFNSYVSSPIFFSAQWLNFVSPVEAAEPADSFLEEALQLQEVNLFGFWIKFSDKKKWMGGGWIIVVINLKNYDILFLSEKSM